MLKKCVDTYLILLPPGHSSNTPKRMLDLYHQHNHFIYFILLYWRKNIPSGKEINIFVYSKTKQTIFLYIIYQSSDCQGNNLNELNLMRYLFFRRPTDKFEISAVVVVVGGGVEHKLIKSNYLPRHFMLI